MKDLAWPGVDFAARGEFFLYLFRYLRTPGPAILVSLGLVSKSPNEPFVNNNYMSLLGNLSSTRIEIVFLFVKSILFVECNKNNKQENGFLR